MTVYGICMVRDEDDIIGATVAHMLEQVDHVGRRQPVDGLDPQKS